MHQKNCSLQIAAIRIPRRCPEPFEVHRLHLIQNAMARQIFPERTMGPTAHVHGAGTLTRKGSQSCDYQHQNIPKTKGRSQKISRNLGYHCLFVIFCYEIGGNQTSAGQVDANQG